MLKRTKSLGWISTWVVRVLFVLLLFLIAYLLTPLFWYGWIICSILSLFIICNAKVDIGVDNDVFYVFDSSVLRLFSNSKKIDIKDIHSLVFTETVNTNEVLIFMKEHVMRSGGVGGVIQGVEIVFKNGDFEHITFPAYRREYNDILKGVKQLVQSNHE